MGRTGLTVGLIACALTLAACGQGGQAPPAAPSATAGTPSEAVSSLPVLVVTVGDVTQKFTSDELLARADVATIEAPDDASYHRAMSYRAVPLRALLPALQVGKAGTMEMRATDGFVAQLPSALIEGEATPWIAVEDPAHPWPLVPGKTISAGPFYLVWQNPERAGVSPEQWPYALASVTAVASPMQRWPAIAVDASVPAKAPARRGQEVFITNCLACHRLGDAGEATAGPDLLRPMPVTAYFTDAGLRGLIRDPASVRDWPGQQMPAFDDKVIADADIDAVIAYLRYLAARSK